jgi:glutamate formiminotransferase
MKIIECVPNFSEGRDSSTINSIVEEIKKNKSIELLDVDPGKDTNRTVVTFIGSPDDVIEAAFNAIKKASELIDMRYHSGEHPRMGATDVCPLIPVSNVSMKECIGFSKILAKRVAKELNIPIFLYEESATTIERQNLANIRKGEYEGMAEKLLSEKWKPDYGKATMNMKAGVTAIGARNYLIAYNINLNTTDKKIASDIALDIRELGRARRDSKGKIIRFSNGEINRKPGKLKATKAVGWYIDEYKKAQVSMNLINYKITSIHKAFEEVRKQARKRGLRVTGSEIVGLIPKEALLEAGLYYIKKQNKCKAVSENNIIHMP